MEEGELFVLLAWLLPIWISYTLIFAVYWSYRLSKKEHECMSRWHTVTGTFLPLLIVAQPFAIAVIIGAAIALAAFIGVAALLAFVSFLWLPVAHLVELTCGWKGPRLFVSGLTQLKAVADAERGLPPRSSRPESSTYNTENDGSITVSHEMNLMPPPQYLPPQNIEDQQGQCCQGHRNPQ